MKVNRTARSESDTADQGFAAELHGKVALVTGANRGIGRAIALALAKAGADVAVNYHTHAEEANAACSEIEGLGRRAVACKRTLPSQLRSPGWGRSRKSPGWR
jgi:S-adenosylhomocysteine hydrolase